MKLRLTAALEGDTVCPATLEAIGDQCTIVFHPDAQGAVREVSVEMPMSYTLDSLPRFTPSTAGPHQISLPLPQEFEVLQQWLQYIESQGAFWFGVKRIHWATVKVAWIPETDAEKAALNVYSSRHSTSYDRRAAPISPSRIVSILSNREALDYLTIPLSFYREGVVDFEAHRYVNSFFNFYFFLEGLYADGKSRNAHVKEAFRSHSQLRIGVEYIRKELGNADQSHNLAGLAGFLTEMRCDDSTDGLIGLLVEVRGRLHHYSIKDKRLHGHPMNQHDFQPIAFFAMGVCLGILPQLLSGKQPT